MASRPFALITALRMVPNCLLREYLIRLGHNEFDWLWDSLKEKEIAPILQFVESLPDHQRDQIESGLHSVSDLACDAGMSVLFQVASDFDLPELATEVSEKFGTWGQAMWIWLNCPQVFEKGEILFQLEQMSFWRKRTDLPNNSPDVSPMAIEQLSYEISDLLRDQGRGKECTAEWLKRGDTYYFFAHPDDFVSNILVHDREGHLAPRAIRQTLYIVFAYRPTDQSLELYAKGLQKSVKERLEAVFAKTILHWDLDQYDLEAAYELDRLKYEFNNLNTDPADRVSVRIRKLRLSARNGGRSVEIKIDDSDPTEIIGKAIRELLRTDDLPLSEWRVTFVTFCFVFHYLDGRKPGKQSFDVGYPRSCSLRNARPERVELIQKYLKKWDIDLADPPKYAVVAMGE